MSLKTTMSGIKDQIMSLFKTKFYSKPKRTKTVRKEIKQIKNTEAIWRKHKKVQEVFLN